MVAEGLRADGDAVFTVENGTDDIVSHIREVTPDVVIVDLDSPDRDTIEHMRQVNRHSPSPVVMFVDRSDEQTAIDAVKAGVSAYVVDGLSPSRVRPILEIAIARFQAFSALRDELEKTRTTLAQRKIIDRAKGILMQQRGLDEDSAYKALRKMAMDRNKPLAEIAEQVISIGELLIADKP